MANTVAQHSVATFTSPVNGTTPIDANTVRGNDNTTRTAYNDHDADPGIHVQSSTLASRPVAGTAGRKWITNDSDIYTLWFDDGTNWHPVSSENVALTVYATTALSKGDVVKVTGWNNGQDLAEVAKVSSASDVAFAIMSADVTINTMGYATNTGLLIDVNTNAFTAGDILYPNTSGGLTATKPTSGIYQPVAYVLRKNTNNGVLYVEFSAPRIVEASANTASTVVLRDASGDFSAGTITATAVNTTTIDLTNLEVTNIKAKDGTASMTLADSTGVVTVSAAPVLSALTASQAVFTNSSKALVSNAITGTGNVVMSASPTLTGTIGAANLTLSGTLGVTSTATFTTPLADSNLATISTAGKVSNSATTATSANTASAIVARDASGNFTAGTITATLSGAAPAGSLSGTTLASNVVSSSLTSVGTLANLTVTNPISGSVTGSSGSTTGNAATATALQTARAINGVSFNGTADITVTAAAGTLSGSTLASGVTASSLQSVGTLTTLKVETNNPTLQVKDTSTAGSVFINTDYFSGGADQIRSDVNHMVIGTDADKYVAFKQNDTERMRLTSTGLGIGTSSPSATYGKLTVAGGVTISEDQNAKLQIGRYSSGVPYGYLKMSANSSGLRFTNPADTADLMELNASGNLGLGVTPSAWASSAAGYSVLQVRNAAFYGISTNISRMSANAFVDGSGVNTYISNGYATRHDQQDGEFKWLTAPSGTAGNAISFTQAMTLDASGNFGVGPTTPSGSAGYKYVAVGGGSSGAVFSLRNASNVEEGAFYVTNGTSVTLQSGAFPLVFSTNAAERARITTGGALLVARISQLTGENFGCYANGNNNAAFQVDGNFANLTLLHGYTATGTATQIAFLNYNGIAVGSITSSSTATAYNTSSDRRLKTSIVPAAECGTLIDAIQIVQHDWKSGGHNRFGVIAQDLAHVAPEAVKVGDDGDNIADVWGVDYSKLVPMLVKEIQSLRGRVAALEA